jgi:uncharacterized protein YndB with AHSA1/START domain
MIIDTKEQLLVDQTIHIAAPQESVFALLTDLEQMKRWQPATQFEPKIGGTFRLVKGEWICVGEIVEIDQPRVIAYTWDWENAPIGARTVLTYELTEDGTGTLVHLSHTGFVNAEQAANHRKGWTHYLGRLKTAGEGGDPGPDSMGM